MAIINFSQNKVQNKFIWAKVINFEVIKREMQKKDLTTTAISLQSKIEKLILLHRKATEELQLLSNENLLLKEKLYQQEGLLNDLTSELNAGKFKANGISDEEKVLIPKDDLKKMVRDIDRCIALLSEKK